MEKEAAKKTVVSPSEGMQILGLSRNSFMKLLHSGQLKSVRAGRRWLIPLSAIDDFLNK